MNIKNLEKKLQKNLKKNEKEINEEFEKENNEESENKAIIYRITFIDSFRFMSTSLPILVDNLSNRKTENGKCVNCNSYLEYIKIRKCGRLIFECFDCKRRYTKNISDDSL